MAYQTVSSGQAQKWTSVGQKVEGFFLGLASNGEYKGKPTFQARFQGLDGKPIVTRAPAALQRELPTMPVGVLVLVEFLGEQVSKGGNKFQAFNIQADYDRTLAKAALPASPVLPAPSNSTPAGNSTPAPA